MRSKPPGRQPLRLAFLLITVLPLLGFAAEEAARPETPSLQVETSQGAESEPISTPQQAAPSEAAPSMAAPAEVAANETEVIGHYETGVGTTDSASAGTVTYKRVQDLPLLRPGDVIQLVPGMVVTQHSGDGKANQYFLRGYNLDHGTDFAIWVDGMPVNMPTHAHGQGYADINFMIPELVQGMDFRKGPYYAEEGDFSSVGAAHIRYFDALPQNVGLVTIGTDNYLRAMGAASPEVADGHLLIAGEAVTNDGPWQVPEDLRKFNGVLRYSRGDSAGGFHAALMAYDAKWNSTDQIPLDLVESGQLDRFGAIDGTDGGESSRYSLSFGGYKTIGTGQAHLDAYVISYSLDLWSNFTYFLDNQVKGDQFQQTDRRTVYGLLSSYSWANKLGNAEMTNTVGLQARYDDIDTVALYKTQARQIYDTTRQDAVGELGAGLYFQNAAQWTSWFRTLLGLRWDYYDFNVDSSIPQNSGGANANLWSPKLSLIFGPWAKTEYFVNAGYGFHSNDARGTTLHVDPSNPTEIVDPVDPLVQTKGAELGIRTELIRNLQSSLSLWMLEQDSEILFVGDAGTSEPSRPSKRQGVEWINYWRPLPWLLVNGELAVTKARFTDDDPAGDRIPGALESMATLGVTVENYRNWFGTIQVNYFGARPLIEDNSVRSDTTTITNARVGYQINKNFRVQLDVFNLFDATGSDIEYFYQSFVPRFDSAPTDRIHFHPVEPRQVRFSVIAHF